MVENTAAAEHRSLVAEAKSLGPELEKVLEAMRSSTKISSSLRDTAIIQFTNHEEGAGPDALEDALLAQQKAEVAAEVAAGVKKAELTAARRLAVVEEQKATLQAKLDEVEHALHIAALQDEDRQAKIRSLNAELDRMGISALGQALFKAETSLEQQAGQIQVLEEKLTRARERSKAFQEQAKRADQDHERARVAERSLAALRSELATQEDMYESQIAGMAKLLKRVGLVYDPAIHSSKPSPAATPADSPADTEKEVAQTEQSAGQSCGESESAEGGVEQTGLRQNLGGKFTDAWVP